ncbi:MAG: ATP-binding cassette domain-containing protein, partial [Desulfovibrio sp.]|nr:ATP-binding cassette domain-containing protein [Desulfovibrio sp.]
KLLAGQHSEFQGSLYLPNALRASYVSQDASFLCGSLKNFVRERGIEESLFRAVLHRFGFERKQFDTDMDDFSAGQKKKTLLAASLCEEAHLYVWDEPLNYVDVISRIQIESLILEHQPSMVLVEHDQVFLDRVSTAILDLGDGETDG